MFDYKTILQKDRRKNDCWNVCINSLIIHRYFNRVIGIPVGRKAGNMPWLSNFSISRDVFRNFLAGLIDTDGYIKGYINLTQKDRLFLERVKVASKKILNIDFKGPYVNKKINNLPVGWCLQIGNKEGISSFIKQVPLRYKLYTKPL